ncbi:MAG TPA: TolC family protein [Cyclobacteriaceae bacterium]|nr:TolC family protein [Cyclobacteriaceae bacterium]
MKSAFVFLFSFLIPYGYVLGQDTLRLNFDEAVKIALQNNILLRQEKNNLESAIAVERASKAQYLPNLSASGQAMHLYGQQFDLVKGDIYFLGSDRVGGSITAYYTLFNGMGRYNTLRRSGSLKDSQENLVERTEQQIIFNVAQQYLQALLDRELLRIANENLTNQKTTLRQIEGFVAAGTRPLSDQLNQEAEVERLEVLRIRAENKLRIDKALLSQTLMMEPGIDIDLIEPEWGFESILVQDFALDELYQEALASRPDYRKSLTDQNAAFANLGVARGLHFPTISAFFDYGSNYSSLVTDQNNERVSFNKQFFEENRTSALGLQISIPIFDQYRTISQKIQAGSLVENAKLTEQNMKLTIYREVQNAYLDMAAARNEYLATQKQFEAAEEANKIQQERYEVGVGDLVELSTSVQRFVEAASSRANAQYTLLFQKVILDYYMGNLNKDDLH